MDCIHQTFGPTIYVLRHRIAPLRNHTSVISSVAHIAYSILFLSGLIYAAYLHYHIRVDFCCLADRHMKVIYGLTIPNFLVFMPLAFLLPPSRGPSSERKKNSIG